MMALTENLVSGAAMEVLGTTQVAGLSDADEWSATAEALTTLGFSPERQTQLMELVAAVLAIGNISFQSNRAARTRPSASHPVAARLCCAARAAASTENWS